MALGIAETIPAKIINEIPLPIPFCVICSPIHIKSMVPVNIETAETATNVFISIEIAPCPFCPVKEFKPIETPTA